VNDDDDDDDDDDDNCLSCLRNEDELKIDPVQKKLAQ
jgi:hypothetical protein